jgi:hypothetical protein
MGNDKYNIDRFNGLYPGFEQDRDMLRKRLPEVDIKFRRGCEELAISDDYIGRPAKLIARTVMRILVTNVLAAGE